MTEGDDDTRGSDRRRSTPARVARYEILGLLGRGATGAVYRARDPTIGRDVALKVIAADWLDAGRDDEAGDARGRLFHREALACGALLHPNVVTLHDAGRDGDAYYLAMELVAGETFADEIRREAPLAPQRVIEVGIAAAEALEYAHERGVVHRDVKPANLLILPDGTVKVADFGIARLMSKHTESDAHVLGTPGYSSPEQLEGHEGDRRSDVFSLGVVLYEALCGQHPFRRATLASTLNAILTTTPPPPEQIDPTIPPSLSEAVTRALERDPARRFQRARELAAALAQCRSDLPHAPRAVGRRRTLLLVLGASTLGGIAALVLLRRGDHSGNPGQPVEGSPLVLPDVQGDQLPTTFAVMLFKTISSDPEDAWMAEALQDSFNSVLSQISGVKVYSKEFLDFQIKKRSFTEMEAVSHLGIDKMLSGSLIVDGDVLRLDLYVIDVDTGTLDASYPSVGAANDFLDFRSRIVVEMLDRLELPMSDRERAELARLETGDVEPLRRLLEIESGSGTEPGPEPEKKPSAPAEPHSWIRWLEPDVAWAADDTMDGPSSDAAEISELLVRYGEAMERESVDELAAMYTSYSDEQRRAQEQFFDAVADLRVEITQIEIDVVGDEAIVSYTRSDRFIDVPTGQPMHLSVRPTKVLARQDGVWRLVAGSE